MFVTTEINEIQNINAWVSLVTAVAGFAFVFLYAILARWWTSYEGKILMGTAAAITALSLYTFLVVHVIPESTALRIARVVIVGIIGLSMVSQTIIMVRAQITRRKKGIK